MRFGLKSDLPYNSISYYNASNTGITNLKNELYINDASIHWEQGTFSSTGESDTAYQVRTSSSFQGGFLIHNRNSSIGYIVARIANNGTGGFDYPWTSTWVNNEFLYIPFEAGYHVRIRQRYMEPNILLDLPSLDILRPIDFSQFKKGTLEDLGSILINNDEVDELSVSWKEGVYTSSGFNSSNKQFFSTDTKIPSNFILLNPNGYKIIIARFHRSDDSFSNYVALNSPVDNEQNVYTDNFVSIDNADGYYYFRVMIKRHRGDEPTISESQIKIFQKKDNNKLIHQNLQLTDDVSIVFNYGTITSTGFNYAVNNEGVSGILNLNDCGGLKIHNNDPSIYRYAIYYHTPSHSVNNYSLFNSSFLYDDMIITPVKGWQYVIRIGVASGTFNLTNAVSNFSFKILPKKINGYYRNYTDIISDLVFERKKIDSAGAITDSTTTILTELPKIGNIEIKMNTPNCKFKVIMKDNQNNITDLSNGYSFYQYRYTGDQSSTYYCQIAYENETSTIQPNAAATSIRAYRYEDYGQEYQYSKTNLLQKNIAFFGDSIVQGRFPKNNTMICMAKPYSVLISEVIGDFTPMNYGIGGGLVYDNDWKSMYRNVGNVINYDIVFFCAGTNDYGNNISEANFKNAYNYVINTLIANNTEVVVLTPVYRTNSTGQNSAGLALLDYVNFEKAIAESNNLQIIDLYNLTKNNEIFIQNLPDGLHPNEIGHQIIADLILNIYE